jgi:hypothetical protein
VFILDGHDGLDRRTGVIWAASSALAPKAIAILLCTHYMDRPTDCAIDWRSSITAQDRSPHTHELKDTVPGQDIVTVHFMEEVETRSPRSRRSRVHEGARRPHTVR